MIIAGPFHAIAGRHRQLLVHPFLRFCHGRTEVAFAHAVFQRHEPLCILAVDVGGAGFDLDLAEVAQRDVGGRRLGVRVRQRDRDRADGIDAAPVFRRKPDREREVHLTLVDFGHFLTADGGLHHRVDVGDRKPVACSLGAIDTDDEVGLAEQVEGRRIGDARDLSDLGLQRLGQPFQFAQIAAEDLDRVFALHAGYCFLDVVLNVLREIEIDADEFPVELLAEPLDQGLLVQPLRPLIERLERDEELGEERTVRVGAIVAASLLGEDRPHGRIALDDVADARDRLHAGFERDGRRHHGAYPHVAFFELGQELGAEPRAEHAHAAEERERDQR